MSASDRTVDVIEGPQTSTQPADKNERFFAASHVKSNLRARSVRGGVISLGAQALVVVVGLGATAVLARLLTPADFGLVAMVVVVRELVHFFSEMGLPMATVQRANINHAQVSTLFWINLSLGLGFAMVFAALAVPVAWFYDDARLVTITLVSALGVPLGVAGSQHIALLRRQMRFGALAATRVGAAVAGAAVAVAMALAEFQYWALVAMHLARSGATSIGAWWLCGWRPGRPVRDAGIGSMLRFGGNLTGVQLTNFVRRNLDKVLIGKFVDASTLGWYTKAASVLQAPVNNLSIPLTGVAVPALSRLADEPERYCRYYRKSIQFPMLIGFPLVAFAFLATPELVLLVFGNQWTQAVPLFRALLPAALVATTSVATGWVFVSLGRTDRHLKNALVVNVLTIAGIVIGLRWGALGVAVAISFVHCAARIPSILYCFKGTPLRLRDVLLAGWRPAWASLVAVAAGYAVSLQLGSADHAGHLVVRLGVYGVSFGLAFLLGWILTPGGWRSLKDTVALVRELRRGRDAA